MWYIGVDPGASGSICVLESGNNFYQLQEEPLFVSLDPNKHTTSEVIQALEDEIDLGHCKAALEEVHSLHGMSAKSNFAFGGMFWRARTILEALYIPYELVQPKVWQKAVGAPTRKFLAEEMDLKVAVADMAQGLYPNAKLHGPRGGLLDGRSDALMIAHYLRLKTAQGGSYD